MAPLRIPWALKAKLAISPGSSTTFTISTSRLLSGNLSPNLSHSLSLRTLSPALSPFHRHHRIYPEPDQKLDTREPLQHAENLAKALLLPAVIAALAVLLVGNLAAKEGLPGLMKAREPQP